MGEDDRDPADVSGYEHRLSDLGPVTVTPGDYTTSPAALAVLRGQGVQAWRQWCAEHTPDT